MLCMLLGEEMRHKVFHRTKGVHRVRAVALALSASLASSVAFPMSVLAADKDEINGVASGTAPISSNNVASDSWAWGNGYLSGQVDGSRICAYNFYTERFEWYDLAEYAPLQQTLTDGNCDNDPPLAGGQNFTNGYAVFHAAQAMHSAKSNVGLCFPTDPNTGQERESDSYTKNHNGDWADDAANAIFAGDSDWVKQYRAVKKLNSNQARNAAHNYSPQSMPLPGSRTYAPITSFDSGKPPGMDDTTWQQSKPPTSPLGILAWRGEGAQSSISKATGDITEHVSNRLGLPQITYIFEVVGIISAILIIIFSLVELLIVNTPILMGIVKLRVAHGFLTVIVILMLPFLFDVFMSIVKFFMT